MDKGSKAASEVARTVARKSKQGTTSPKSSKPSKSKVKLSSDESIKEKKGRSTPSLPQPEWADAPEDNAASPDGSPPTSPGSNDDEDTDGSWGSDNDSAYSSLPPSPANFKKPKSGRTRKQTQLRRENSNSLGDVQESSVPRASSSPSKAPGTASLAAKQLPTGPLSKARSSPTNILSAAERQSKPNPQQSNTSVSEHSSDMLSFRSRSSSATDSKTPPNPVTMLDVSNQRLVELPKTLHLSKMSHITRFHAVGNQLSSLSSDLALLRDLREVVLASNAFRELPRVLLQLSNLATLDMSRNRLSHLPADIQQLQAIIRLKLNRNKLKDIPVTIGYLHKLEVFDVSSNRLTRLPDSIGLCTCLRQISIAANFITELPEALSGLGQLDTLLCHTNRLTKLPVGLKTCRSLKKLNISDNILSEIPPWVKHLTNLDSLKFMLNQITILPASLGRLTNLASLVGARNRVAVLPPTLSRLVKLELLDMGRNIVQSVPKELALLTGLKRLCLMDNKIKEVPSELAALTKTTILLSGNRLWSLPYQLSQPEFEADGGYLEIQKNPFGAFPENIRSDPLLVLKFLRTLKRKATWRRVKLVLVGEENVGKTSLRVQLIKQSVKRNPLHVQLTQGALSGHSHFHPHSSSAKKRLRSLNSDSGDPVATDGIEIDDWDVYVDATESFEPSVGPAGDAGETQPPTAPSSGTSSTTGTSAGGSAGGSTVGVSHFNKISFSCWDFAGQDLYYGTHQFFLTRHSVHLIVFNMLDEKASKVEYWLKTIKVRVGDVPVIIVGTHRDDKRCDKKYREQVIRSMRKRFDSRFPFIKGYICVSCKTGKGIPELERLVLHIATKQIIEKHGEVPQAYLLLDGVLKEKRIHHQHMSLKEFCQLAASCGVPDKYMSHCLEFMNDAGVIIYFNEETSRGNGSGLSDIVILDPQMIVDLMASVITLKHSYARDGILPLDALPHIWRDYSEDKYQWLLKLLEKFEIAYSLDPSALVNVRGAAFTSSPEGGSAPHSGDEVDSPNSLAHPFGRLDAASAASEPAPKLSRRSQSDPSLDSAAPVLSPGRATSNAFVLRRRKSSSGMLVSPQDQLATSPKVSIHRKSSSGSLENSLVSDGRASSLTETGAVIIVPSLLPDEPDQSQLLEHWESGRSRWSMVCGRRYLCKFLPLGFFSRLIVRILHLPKLRPLYYWKNGIILERGNERALIEYDDVEYIVDFTVKTKPEADQPSWSLVRQIVENVEALLIGWYRLRPQVLVPCSHCLGAKYLHTDPHHEMQMMSSLPIPFERPTNILGLSTTPTVTMGESCPFRFPTDATGNMDSSASASLPTFASSEAPTTPASSKPALESEAVMQANASEADETADLEDILSPTSSSPGQESNLAFLGDGITPFYFSIEECMLAVQEGKSSLTCIRVLKGVEKPSKNKRVRAKAAPRELMEITTNVDVANLSPDLAFQDVEALAIPFQSLELVSKLAEGGYSELHKGKIRATGEIVAVKILKNQDAHIDLLSESFRSLQHETFLMRALHHPNLVELRGICTRPLCMVMELFSLGSLNDYLYPGSPKFRQLTWQLRIRIAIDIAKAMEYLHSEDVIHRDLRSPNILVNSFSEDVDPLVKVGDLGMSVICARGVAGGDFNECWTAPEIFRGEAYTLRVDQYSYGIILWELLQRGFPFYEYSKRFAGKPRLDFFGAVINGLRPSIPSGSPKKYTEIIKACWALEPELRPPFTEIVETLTAMLPEASKWKQL